MHVSGVGLMVAYAYGALQIQLLKWNWPLSDQKIKYTENHYRNKHCTN